MNYESSYDSGRMPFKPDLTRGYWASSSDFIISGLGLAFRLDVFSSAWFLFAYLGTAAIVPYMICLMFFVVPFMVIQSFLGQFSSTGFISAFRVAPLFKGIGFISLAVNLAILTYYSIFAAVPLLYLFHSLRPTLPWSCEGLQDWAYNFTTNDVHHLCNVTTGELSKNETLLRATIEYQVPSILFFSSRFNDTHLLLYHGYHHDYFEFSWEMALCTLLTWSIITAVFYKCTNIEQLGKLLRYIIYTTLLLLLIIVLRFSLLPENADSLFLEFVLPQTLDFVHGIPIVGLYVLSAFGAGWGSIITLSSFNKFRTNLISHSWFICLGQMCVFLAFAFLTHLVDNHFRELKKELNNNSTSIYHYVNEHWILYLSSGSVMATMEWPNMWCIIFYTMLILAALISMITNLLCIVQSLCDEFETLRARKRDMTFVLIAAVALVSLSTCTSHGISYFMVLTADSLFTQTALNLLLLLVVLWVYGRVRLQRDLQFMLNRHFSTWKVYILRFVAPIGFLLILVVSFYVVLSHYFFMPIFLHIVADTFIVLPWIFVPAYIVVILLQTSGSVKIRFQRCCRPMDWYPVELEERQRYEESMHNTDLTHQLNEFANEIVM